MEDGRSVVDKSKIIIMAGSALKRGDDNSYKVVGLRDIILHDYNHRTKENDIKVSNQ